jgi:transcriptional regulator NrdR family protein
MSASPAACPRCGSTDLEIVAASRDGETADEKLVERCRRCGERFTVASKID